MRLAVATLLACQPRGGLIRLSGSSSSAYGRKGYAVSIQNMVDRGEAATLEEAGQLLAGQGRAAQLQSMVDRGEAATLEEAGQLTGKRLRDISLQNMVDRGEAATLEEASTSSSMNGGVAHALAAGKYTRFPGVVWRKDSKKWRVQFCYKGSKVSLGSYGTEEEAARVHDAYVRKHGLPRPLHFPEEGERSSAVYRESYEERSKHA